MLEYVFEADSYTDFIYRYEVVKQLSNYNTGLINEFEQLIIELNEKELNKKLESEKIDITLPSKKTKRGLKMNIFLQKKCRNI